MRNDFHVRFLLNKMIAHNENINISDDLNVPLNVEESAKRRTLELLYLKNQLSSTILLIPIFLCKLKTLEKNFSECVFFAYLGEK